MASGAGRFVQPLLFQVSAQDPVLLASTAAFMLIVSLLASARSHS